MALPPKSLATPVLRYQHLSAPITPCYLLDALLERNRSPGPYPDCKVVHSIHLQVLSDLQILHFGFIPATRNKKAVSSHCSSATDVGKAGGGFRREQRKPNDFFCSTGTHYVRTGPNIKPLFTSLINKDGQQIPAYGVYCILNSAPEEKDWKLSHQKGRATLLALS